MEKLDEFALLPDEEYYLNMNYYNYSKDDYFKILSTSIPSSWSIHRSNIFISCLSQNYKYLPSFGWKIHIAPVISESKQVLEIVSKFCFENNLNFKCYLDKKVYSLMNSKSAPRGSSGKFITIYPMNEKDFKDNIKKIYLKLKGYRGPYILTDKRYMDDSIIFYRYGAIISDPNSDGIDYITGPNNQIFKDDRQPYYKKPSWIADPFDNSDISDDSDNSDNNELKLNNRFLIKSALNFSNIGGTYFAKDVITQKDVVVKEARPFTMTYEAKKDAMTLKRNEYQNLITIHQKHKNIDFIPYPIDCFFQWEHMFIVESYKSGTSLWDFIHDNNPLFKSNFTIEKFKLYVSDVIRIIKDIILKVKLIHEAGIAIGDISSENILVKDYYAYFIDFDSSLNSNVDNKDTTIFGTIGFQNDKLDRFERDYASIANLLHFMLAPTHLLVELDKSFPLRNLKYFEEIYGLPHGIKELYSELYNGMPQKFDFKKIERNTNLMSFKPLRLQDNKLNLLSENLISFIERSSLDYGNQLFPSTYLSDDVLSMDHGVSGVLFTFGKNNIFSEHLEEWYNWLEKEINIYDEDITMKDGLIGILWSLLDYDNPKTSNLFKRILKYIEKESYTKRKNISISKGIAGLGMLYLKLYLYNQGNHFLVKTQDIGNEIIKNVDINKYELEEVGLYNGMTGVSLFFYYLHQLTGNKKYADFGLKALKKDLEKGKKVNDELLFPYTTNTNEDIYYPYLYFGTAGVLTVVARYLNIYNNDTKLNNLFDLLINGCDTEYTIDTTLNSGLAGIVNVFYDLGVILNQKKYTVRAHHLLANISHIMVPTDKGINCPGKLLLRYSSDYSEGAAGILDTVLRIKNQSMNYFIFIDDLIKDFDNEIALI